MYFSVDYQNFCIQSQLSLRDYPELHFPKHLIPNKNQEKGNLYGKIPSRTSVDRPPFWITKQYGKKNFIGSTWGQVGDVVNDVTFSRQ